MDDADLLRYSRQILLPAFGIEGQESLRRAHALIVGVGGLGSVAALYLAAAGIGRLTLADGDQVEVSNLQRQLAHRAGDIGRSKAASGRDALLALNPTVDVIALPMRLEGAILEQAVQMADVVLDGSDNFATRFAVNAACRRAGKPLVSGAAIRLEGQFAVFDPRRAGSPCYRCLYPDNGDLNGDLSETCSESGVLGPVVGVIGSLQALEAIKLLAGIGDPDTGCLLLFDAKRLEWRTLRFARDPCCPVCAASAQNA